MKVFSMKCVWSGGSHRAIVRIPSTKIFDVSTKSLTGFCPLLQHHPNLNFDDKVNVTCYNHGFSRQTRQDPLGEHVHNESTRLHSE